MDRRDRKGLQALKAFKVQRDHKARQELPVLREQLGLLVRQERREHKAQPDHRGHRARLDRWVLRDRKGQPDLPEQEADLTGCSYSPKAALTVSLFPTV